VNRIGFTSGPNTPGPRGGSDAARDLLPDHHHAQEAQALPAVLSRHVEQPQAQLLGLALKVGPHLRAHRGTVHRIHLDRDELAVDEGLDRILEQLQLFRQLEVHVFLSVIVASSAAGMIVHLREEHILP
jgi:hypothetical protein